MQPSVFALLTAGVGAALMGLSVLILARPRRALQALARFGSTPTIHFGELSIRAVVGAVFMLGAEATRFPLAITVIGAFLIVSALVLMLLPRRWHAAYSRGWARRIPVWSVPPLGLVSLVAGGLLFWVAT